MSLIHWWPLNGDLQDKIGANDLVNTNTTYTQVNSSGRLGECYKCTSNTAGTLRSTNTINLGRHQSMFCWIYMDSIFTSSNLNAIMGQHRYQYPCGLGLTIRAVSDTTGYISIDTGSTANGTNASSQNGGYRTYNVYRGGTLLQTGKWYHLGFVYDNGTIRLYVNGNREDLYNVNTNLKTTEYTDNHLKNMNIFEDYFGAFMWSLASKTVGDTGTHANYIAKGSLCDIRLYDHALSDAEVKELSKALVVHYTFDDILIEPTTNIITGIESAHGKASLESGRVKINWSPSKGDSYFMFSCSQAIKANGVYTLSFDCEGLKSGEVATFAVSNLSASSYNIALKNGRNSLTFTAGSDLMNDINTHNRLFFDDKTNTDGAVFYLSNFQLEERDHATPYTLTSRESMLYNETSLIQPDHKANLQLTRDASSKTYNLKCAGSTAINTPVTGDISQGATAAFWIKTPTYPSGNEIVFADYNSRLAFGFYSGTQAIISCGGQSSAVVSNLKTSWQSGWNHVVITRNNSTFSCYLNGVKLSQSGSNNWSSNAGYSTIGCRRNGSSYTQYSNCLISDFRLYYSLLNEDEIKDLYKTKAYITDRGDIETYHFIEDCNSLQVTNKHCVEARDIQEIGNEEYEQLEYIASTGTQYIDTGVYWTSEKATIVADLMVTAWKGSSTIFGSEEGYTSPYSSSKRYFAHILHAGGANGSYSTYVGTGSIGTVTLTKDTRSLIEYVAHGDKKVTAGVTVNGKKTIYVNNKAYSGTILTHQNSTQTAANRGHIYIFSNHNAYNGTGAIQPMGAMRLYRFTMIQDDKYIRDFIPCRRKSDSKVGLFDLVTGQFYTTPTTVDFTAGSVITNEDTTAKFLSGGSIQARQFIEI